MERNRGETGSTVSYEGEHGGLDEMRESMVTRHACREICDQESVRRAEREAGTIWIGEQHLKGACVPPVLTSARQRAIRDVRGLYRERR